MAQDETEKIGIVPIEEATLHPCVMVLTGLSTGQSYRLEVPESVLGRAEECTITLSDRGISRRHASFTVKPDGGVVLQDLGSTNGTFVGMERIRSCELFGGERLRFGSSVTMKFDFRDPTEEKLLSGATQDALTGALNRRYFEQRLKEAVARSKRHETALCCAFIDADHFKAVNDHHGHAAGDDVLKEIVRRVTRLKREEDIFARVGGEEFVLLVPGETLSDASHLLERIRQAVEREAFPVESLQGEKEISVTISVGLACTCGKLTGDELMRAADEALLRAKQAGRNRLEIAECR